MKRKQLPAPDPDEARIRTAIRQVGFRSFARYLAARTVRPDGRRTWTLIQMADELAIPRPIFLGYHARWVDAQEAARGGKA